MGYYNDGKMRFAAPHCAAMCCWLCSALLLSGVILLFCAALNMLLLAS